MAAGPTESARTTQILLVRYSDKNVRCGNADEFLACSGKVGFRDVFEYLRTEHQIEEPVRIRQGCDVTAHA